MKYNQKVEWLYLKINNVKIFDYINYRLLITLKAFKYGFKKMHYIERVYKNT